MSGISTASPKISTVVQKGNIIPDLRRIQAVDISAKLVANSNKDCRRVVEKSRKEEALTTTLPGASKFASIATIEPQTTVVNSIDEASRQDYTGKGSVAEAGLTVEFKNEFLDENPSNLDDTVLPDTPTLMARAHSITQAAANALSSNTTMPTDIRLMADPMSTSTYVPSFGVCPTLVDTKGTRMYTFLHPAKYSRNHGNVLLDYCCPNLDGPMPAIDPTRIHAQVQTPVIELPAFIVLTTKVVTRAELESNSSTIPSIIKKKAEKLRNSIAIHQNLSSSPATKSVASTLTKPTLTQSIPVLCSTTQSQHLQQLPTPSNMMRPPNLSPAPHLSPALNALTKYLPSTTTITPKIRPSLPPSSHSITTPNQISAVSVVPMGSGQLNEMQVNLLRSNLRRFDVILKKLVQPYDKLNFTERHQIIDNLVSSGKFVPKDLERTIVLMEEYLKQINSKQQVAPLNSYPMSVTATSSPLPSIQMPPLHPAPNIASASSVYKAPTHQPTEQQEIHNSTTRKIQSNKQQNSLTNTTTIKQRQVPIYDTERNIIGYQLQVVTPSSSASKSFTSSKSSSGAILPSIDGPNQRKTVKRTAQDSPRVFYTTQPLQTSTPKANLNSVQYSVSPLVSDNQINVSDYL